MAIPRNAPGRALGDSVRIRAGLKIGADRWPDVWLPQESVQKGKLCTNLAHEFRLGDSCRVVAAAG